MQSASNVTPNGEQCQRNKNVTACIKCSVLAQIGVFPLDPHDRIILWFQGSPYLLIYDTLYKNIIPYFSGKVKPKTPRSKQQERGAPFFCDFLKAFMLP